MLSVVDKYEINEQELPIKTLFFNDLSPLILKTKIKKLEQVKKNLMRSISHEFSTYLNGAYNCIYQFKEENENSKLIEEALNYLQLQIYKINDFQDFQSILSH